MCFISVAVYCKACAPSCWYSDFSHYSNGKELLWSFLINFCCQNETESNNKYLSGVNKYWTNQRVMPLFILETNKQETFPNLPLSRPYLPLTATALIYMMYLITVQGRGNDVTMVVTYHKIAVSSKQGMTRLRRCLRRGLL